MTTTVVGCPPAYRWVPETAVSSDAAFEAADLAASAGVPLDPEQRDALAVVLAERVPGARWAALEAAVIAPRQNVKTHLFKVVALADVFLFGAELVVWTAQEFSTTMEAFRDLKEIVNGADHLRSRVKRITEANGEEAIELLGGQRIRFRARTRTGSRGLTGDRVILDEAFAVQPGHVASMLPTLSAKSVAGNPQILYGSSACLMESAVLRSVVERGRAGGDPNLAYVEWCSERRCADESCTHTIGTPGCVLDDRDAWAEANLALGRRISVEFVEMERRSMTPDVFARERLGWHDGPGGDTDEFVAGWRRRGDEHAEPSGPIVLAVDAAPALRSAAIVACGGGVVEVVAHDSGGSWVRERLAGLVERWAPTAVGIDPTGPAGALLGDLHQAGFSVRGPSNPDGLLVFVSGAAMSRACEALYATVVDVDQTTALHRGQPVLDSAVNGAALRHVADSRRWSRRKSSADISPLVAATIARHLWGQGEDAPAPSREWFGGWA